MQLIKVASKMLYKTIAVSLFARLPTPALLATRDVAARRSYVRFTVMLARFLDLRCTPRIFEEERDFSQSNNDILAT